MNEWRKPSLDDYSFVVALMMLMVIGGGGGGGLACDLIYY